jgi:hypothetical protein
MRRLALVALALLLCSACKVDLSVNIDARDDGSGIVRATVTLDQEAARRLTAVGARLEADDLRAAGWTITQRERSITATKPFANPRQLGDIIDEVAGPRRPLRNFTLTRKRSAFETDMAFSGVVDLTAGVEAFSDDRLREQAGDDLAALLDRSQAQLDELFGLRIGVRLPGDVDSNAPSDAANGAVWQPKLGERARLTASASDLDTRRIVFVAVAVVAGLALVLQVVRTMRRHGQDKDAPPVH